MAEYLKQTAFAARIGRSDGYVTQLKKAGRLVMDATGKRVEVEASIRRIAETEDPSKAGVALRHARARAESMADDPGAHDSDPTGGGQHVGGPTPKQVYTVYQARKMKADAEMSEMERDQRAGKLLPRESAEFVIADLASGVRARLESVPDRFAPILFPLETLDETRAALVEMVEEQLQSLAQQIERRAREIEAARG